MKGQLTNIVFWILIGLLILWIILKASGYIKSPYWIEVSPYVLITLLFVNFSYRIKEEIRKNVDTAIKPLKELVNEMNNRLSKQEGVIETVLHLSGKRKK